MKTLKLNTLQAYSLKEREMKNIAGGDCTYTLNCGCGCIYAGQPGGSSVEDNKNANDLRGIYTRGCDEGTHTQVG